MAVETEPSYPEGAVPLVEPQPTHRTFVRAVEPDYALVKINHARRLVRRGETADSYFGEATSVITTTTIDDTKLNLLPWEHERDVVVEFDPAFHVPTDYSIYEDHAFDERIDNVETCMRGTRWMHDELRETGADTRLLPLVKGLTPEERDRCYAMIDHLDLPVATFYATQYFTGSGNNITQLATDVGDVAAESDVELFVIGLLAPNYLERLPRAVRAAAGQHQWRTRVAPTEDSAADLRRAFDELADGVETALSAGLV